MNSFVCGAIHYAGRYRIKRKWNRQYICQKKRAGWGWDTYLVTYLLGDNIPYPTDTKKEMVNALIKCLGEYQ